MCVYIVHSMDGLFQSMGNFSMTLMCFVSDVPLHLKVGLYFGNEPKIIFIRNPTCYKKYNNSRHPAEVFRLKCLHYLQINYRKK